MTRPYSLRNFFRLIPDPLLHRLFEQLRLPHMPADVDGNGVDTLHRAWLALPARQREQAESVFRDIDDMATEEAVRALIEDSRFSGTDLTEEVGRQDGLHAKAVSAYLNYPEPFADTLRFVQADILPGRYWRKRGGLPHQQPDLSAEAVAALQAGFSGYYRENQARGDRCTVEHYLRAGRQHYVFIFLDDYVGTYVGHDGGRLVRRPQRSAFENVFVFDPDAGTLEAYAQGDKRLHNELMQIFCRTVLKQDLPPEEPRRPPYRLNLLKSRDVALATDPEDDIAEVRVRSLRLSVLGSKRRVTLEGDPNRGLQDVYDMLDQYIAAKQLPPALFNVTQATFQFRFRHTGQGRQRSMTFDVSFPDSCNLKSLREEYRILGEKYLRRWGIDCA